MIYSGSKYLHQFIIFRELNALMTYLQVFGIGCSIHYCLTAHDIQWMRNVNNEFIGKDLE